MAKKNMIGLPENRSDNYELCGLCEHNGVEKELR